MATAYEEAIREFDAKTTALAAIFDAKPNLDFTAEESADVKRRNDELNDLGAKLDEMKAVNDIAELTKRRREQASTPATRLPLPGAPDGKGGQKAGETEEEADERTLGELFTASDAYKSIRGVANPKVRADIPELSLTKARTRAATLAFKTTMTTTAGFAPYPPRTPIVVPFAIRRVMVPDLIPSDDVTVNAIIYMEETTFTNSAAPVAEGGTKPESALAYTQRTVPVEVIANWLPVTMQQLEDVPQVEALINNRLTIMVQLAEEDQILNGNGTSPQLVGFYNKSGVQTQAKGADNAPAAMLKAFTKVRNTGFAEPSAVVFHPTDWQNVLLLQDTTGRFIWGNPSDEQVDRIWGKPVVATPAATLGTALTGDFPMFSHISRRMGIRIDVSDSHQDFFIKNLLAIRAEERASLEIYRAAAFCLVTGL